MFELSIESLYNEYHRETFKAQHGFYPKRIKNFSSVTEEKRELLDRFLRFCKNNITTIDPVLYIRACAEFYKYPFKISILGSMVGLKIYREYINVHKNDITIESDESIKNAMKKSLETIREWHVENPELRSVFYFKARSGILPLFVVDIMNGRLSPYVVACLSSKTIESLFKDIDYEVFQENMHMSVEQFTKEVLKSKRLTLFRSEELRILFDKVFALFKNK